jgi:hypothetical protein
MERKIVQSNGTDDMRDQISEWWDDLSEDDMDLINGDQEQLITLLQERYGYTRNIAFLAFMELKIHMAGSAWKSRTKRIAPLGV